VAGRKLLATIRLDEQNYKQVEDLLRPVLANALLCQGKTDEAIDLL